MYTKLLTDVAGGGIMGVEFKGKHGIYQTPDKKRKEKKEYEYL